MTKHTPGPWEVKELSKEKNNELRQSMSRLVGGTQNFLLTKKDDNFETTGYIAVINSEYEANACLIAAAPELLERLKESNEHILLTGYNGQEWDNERLELEYRKNEQAIAKAEQEK